ncbi:SF-assemblin/beta giardin [Seminavis robusta]|uniref:SF-assemblin/beta giardin n=1 Tax=Seminavis robusta TaxID=568900 RepID=A0A9N8DE12_9STRA|nr:SF-assemblin/beta giardin [Seminavis robusta]|eukprot:Sro79_g042890.1 SF-assemblin/beta giardin (292) ;mRNA; r:109975-110850
MTVGTPQPQPTSSQLLSVPSDDNNKFLSPIPRSNTSIMLATTPIEEAVKLDGPEFEQVMKERARIRREKEDSHIAELRVKVARLEAALAAETKRRVDAVRNLEQQAKEEIKQWEDRCRKEIQEQRELVEERVTLLEQRFNELEVRWKQESQQQDQQIHKKGHEFTAALDELRKEAETERKLRLVREGQFLQQIEAHGKDYEDIWDRERQERIECVGELVNQLESNEEARRVGRKSVEARLEQELAQLQQELEQESAERKRSDNEIAVKLDKYTIQFQQSLNILNSDDLFDV